MIHVTVSPMLGYISAADFTVELEENMTAFSSFMEFSSSGLKVSNSPPWSCDKDFYTLYCYRVNSSFSVISIRINQEKYWRNGKLGVHQERAVKNGSLLGKSSLVEWSVQCFMVWEKGGQDLQWEPFLVK